MSKRNWTSKRYPYTGTKIGGSYIAKQPNPYKLQKDIQKLKCGQAGKEWKTHDYAIDAAITQAGTIYPLTKIPQGDQAINREGLDVRIMTINQKGFIVAHGSQSTTVVRYIIFQDTQMHGTYPTVAEVLQSVSPISHKLYTAKGRFNILEDKLIILNVNMTSQLFKRKVEKYVKFSRGRKLSFLGTGVTEGDQGKGSFFVLLIADQETYTPTATVNYRIKFVE